MSRENDSPLPVPEDPPDLDTALAARFLFALDCFDAGAWHEAHEQWEVLWSGEVGARRHLLQALIQLSVALHHRRRGNLAGACSLLERALEHATPLTAPDCGVDPAWLRTELARLLTDATAHSNAPASTHLATDLVAPPEFSRLRADLRRRREERGLAPLPLPPHEEA
jgi:predicted metal-dependent hydrolase